MLNLRPIVLEDVPEAAQCGLEGWLCAVGGLAETVPATELLGIEQAFQAFLLSNCQPESSSTELVSIIEWNGKIGGYYCLDCQSGTLSDLWLSPLLHGQGIASQVLKHVRCASKEAGCLSLVLDVLASNHRALSFFQKEGMERIACFQREDPLLDRHVEMIRFACHLRED